MMACQSIGGLLGILKKIELKADVVANGAEALTALESIPYDLVLMDVQMPEMDGLGATESLRKQDSLRQPIVIAMTAFAMQSDKEKCMDAGMNDYISNPVNLRALAKLIQAILSSTAKEPH